MSDRLLGARSVPTSELTFNASVTSRGAMKTRLVARYAAAYAAMNVRPTRASGSPRTPQSRAESGGVREAASQLTFDLRFRRSADEGGYWR